MFGFDAVREGKLTVSRNPARTARIDNQAWVLPCEDGSQCVDAGFADAV